MNYGLFKKLPFLVTAFVGLVLGGLELGRDRWAWLAYFQRLEWISFDWRVRASAGSQQPLSPDLAVVHIDDASLSYVEQRLHHTWPWPRWVHGVILQEMSRQRAAGVAYDVFFLQARPGDTAPTKPGSAPVSSDSFFAQEIRAMGKVILAAPMDALHPDRLQLPAEPMRGAAAGIGHAQRVADADGTVRRVQPVFQDPVKGQVWLVGILLAAQKLHLKLEEAEISPWQIRIPDDGGKWHVMPLDGHGNLIVRWVLGSAGKSQQNVQRTNISQVLPMAAHRRSHPEELNEIFLDKLIVVGSSGSSAFLRDHAPTPAAKETPLYLVHWNVANSLLTSAFVTECGAVSRCLIVGCITSLVGLLTWRIRALWAFIAVVLIGVSYVVICQAGYTACGWWLPLAVPVIGGVVVTHALAILFRHFIERAHRSRMRGVFARMLSPEALDLLLQQPNISWKPEDREMTVFFADIRDFTRLTDQKDDAAATTDAGFPTASPASRESALETVNAYLTAMVTALKRHGATIDKYMGDSVMAFWGAPLAQPDHAARAVRAAMEVQQTIYEMNQRRSAAIQDRSETGTAGEPAPDPPPILTAGTGISTGMMTVGFMGSQEHLSNYTVFGREVNIASRLEGASGSGNIFITERTATEAARHDPALAALMETLAPVRLKGIAEPVAVSRVIWRSLQK